MIDELFDSTKLSAYFLWERTGHGNALSLWYCAEDIACFLEQSGVLNFDAVINIKRLGMEDTGYIEFVRHLAFRLFIYTNNEDALANWFTAERLLDTGEWIQSVTKMAVIYREAKNNQSVMNEVRSENVRAFYDEQTLHMA